MISKERITNFSSLTWLAEQAIASSVLVYRLGEEKKDEDNFHERIKNKEIGLIVLNKEPRLRPLGNYLVSDNWEEDLIFLANYFFPYKKEKMIFVGITGTNGKTTSADLCVQLLKQVNVPAISIGTLGVRNHTKEFSPLNNTTPGYLELRSIICQHQESASVIVMEVSSHALVQKRLLDIELDYAVWTSFSQDHLDYHKNLEDYFQAKASILKRLKKTGTLYISEKQDEILKRISDSRLTPVKLYKSDGFEGFFKASYNQENLSLAMSVAKAISGEDNFFIEELTPPPGRFYYKSWENKVCIIDFAHTADALENLLKNIKLTFPKKEIITLFGCGGDRDKSKRPLMGKAASSHSDYLVLTSDNPRLEDPQSIIEDIIPGVDDKKIIFIEVDRKLAVQKSLNNLKDNQVLVVAGKGHEDYIDKGGVKTYYSDIAELENFLGEYLDI